LKLKALLATAVLAAFAATAAVAAPAISAGGKTFGQDMSIVHAMLFDHDKIKRTVTDLSNGIRTVTESDDPQVAKLIKEHVASMRERLTDDRVFNVASHTLPTIFANSAKIHTTIEQTPNGVIVTQTSSDPATVAALQGHAREVSDLARGGIAALMRQVMANGGSMGRGGAAAQHDQFGPGMMNHGGPPMMAQMMQRMMQGGGPMQGHGPFQSQPPAQTTPQ
jgi:hypothetical protein